MADGHQLTALLRHGGDRSRLAETAEALTVAEGDLCSAELVERAVMEARPEICFTSPGAPRATTSRARRTFGFSRRVAASQRR